MLVQSHDTGSLVERHALALVEAAWALEVVPRLPARRAGPRPAPWTPRPARPGAALAPATGWR